MVLVLGGFDQDNTVAPDPDRVAKGTQNQTQNDTAFTASRVNIVVPEVYDPKTDRNIALENARMAFPLYPQMEVVQTGPGEGRLEGLHVQRRDRLRHDRERGRSGRRVSERARPASKGRRQVRRRRRHASLHQGNDLVPGRAGGAEGSQPGRPGEEPLDARRHGARKSGPTAARPRA